MALHTDPHRALRYRWCRGETATHWYVGFSNKFPPFLHNWCQTPIPILSDVWAAARGYPHNVPCVSVCVCVWILYVTYLTSAVAMLVKEVHIKQTCADRRTSKYSHKWTPIAILKDTQHYIVLHKLWCFLHRYEHTDVNLLHLSGALEPLWVMWYNTLGLKCYKSWCTCHLFLHHCLLMVKTLIVGMALRKLWVSSPKCTTLIYH